MQSGQPFRHAVHVALVSAQAVPNVTPLLDSGFHPDEVVFLVSPDMRERAEWLAEVVRPRGVRVSLWPIDDAWDIEHVRDRVLELLAEREGESIALNATGGTKPMSIAAYEVCRGLDKPIFYVHPEQDRVIWLHPPGISSYNLEDRVKLEAFLKAYGADVKQRIERAALPERLSNLTQELVRDLERWARPLRILNWQASRAEKNNLVSDRDLSDRDLAAGPFSDLVDRFAQERLLTLENHKLRFKDEESRFFANGGWLEGYVYEVVKAVKKRLDGRDDLASIQDLGRSVLVSRKSRGKDVRNELDVAFLADNRLYIVECKTKYWDRSGGEGPGADALYKLDTLKDLLGGLQARAILVSYQDVPDRDRRRAGDLGVTVCSGREIQRLREYVLNWVG